MIEAGSETTSATFNSMILYLMSAPEAVRKAQEELARIVGDERSPTWDDEDQLPYIRSIVKEILRVRPVASVGSPHYTDGPMIYKNYHIPKNTAVTIFQYGIHDDPKRWDHPEKFDPDRYLSYNLKAGQYVGQSDPNKRDHWAFGGGRRICSGIHLAENSLFILAAKFLWAFTPRPPLNERAEEQAFVVTEDMYESVTTTIPKPFKCRLVPRNEVVVSTLKREWAEARVAGFDLGDKHVDERGIVVGEAVSS
jgi:cytochrome P450